MSGLGPDSPAFQAREIRKFAKILGLAAALLATLPVLIGWLASPQGRQYVPFHLSLDDHMVYAAWMTQAADGHLLFDSRFTTDPQPGLTFHLLFLLLGFVAKFLGVSLTLTLARIGFSFLAVCLLGELLVRLGFKSFAGKYALVIACFGGGLAFLSWQMFGDSFSGPGTWFSTMMQGRQPVDNWQPEAFLFPSMLTNGLFLAAACLIFFAFNCVLDARTSWKPVLPGALAFCALMNIHSYDVLLVGLVLLVFMATLFAMKPTSPGGGVAPATPKSTASPVEGVAPATPTNAFDPRWIARVAVIGLGALPAALWFVYVLANDPVFQVRAATPTYTGIFRQIAVGALPLIVLATLAVSRSTVERRRKAVGIACLLSLLGSLFVLSGTYREGYFLSPLGWAVVTVVGVLIACLFATEDLGWNLLWSWAMVSVTAPYFPALFQRKLSMLLAVPWALIGAIGLARELGRMERQPRNLVAALTLAVVCLSSVFWLKRDVMLAREGVSKTLVHNLVLTLDETKVVSILSEREEGAGVLAMPGVMGGNLGDQAYLNDLAPVLSGLAGVHSYAGHWSETPDFAKRRNEASAFFIVEMPLAARRRILRDWHVQYVVVPKRSTYPLIEFVDLAGLGEVLYDGTQLSLVKVAQE